jgi:hypothetical protein
VCGDTRRSSASTQSEWIRNLILFGPSPNRYCGLICLRDSRACSGFYGHSRQRLLHCYYGHIQNSRGAQFSASHPAWTRIETECYSLSSSPRRRLICYDYGPLVLGSARRYLSVWRPPEVLHDVERSMNRRAVENLPARSRTGRSQRP